MNWRKSIIWLSVLLAIVLIALPIYFIFKIGLCVDNCDKPQLIYYSATVVGGLGSLYAVIVALFGNKILNYIYAEDVQLDLIEDELCEEQEDSSADPIIVNRYYAEITIMNIGRKKIRNCELRITDIVYSERREERPKSIFPRNFTDKNVPCSSEEKKVTLLQNQTSTWPLLSVFPKENIGDPNNNVEKPCRLEISGVNLDDNKNKKGTWIIKYMVQSSEKILKKFEVSFSWDGTWCSRATEMNNVISLKWK